MKLEIKHIAPYLPYNLNNTVGIADWFKGYNCKPILRPISDLDKLVRNEFEKYHSKQKHNEEIINLFCEENGVDELIENIELKSLPYECVEYMFRNHYDVFGLIEQGLAVSIHDVQLQEIKS